MFLVGKETSIIGKVKFETRYGISGHQAAALTIARRFLGCSEKLPRHSVKIYNGKADPVTFFPPVRNRKKHEWSDWGKIRGILLAKFSPYFRGARAGPSSSPRKSTLE